MTESETLSGVDEAAVAAAFDPAELDAPDYDDDATVDDFGVEPDDDDAENRDAPDDEQDRP